MESFIDYTIDGRICGIHTGPLPSGCNPLDPNCDHPTAQEIRKRRVPDYKDTILYECPCLVPCNCAWKAASGCYIVNEKLTALPMDVVFCINDQDVSGVLDLEPCRPFTITVKCPALRDGVVGSLAQCGPVALSADFPTPLSLTFVNGVSDPKQMIAPAQGMVGVAVFSCGVRASVIKVRGFATS